MLFRSDYIKLDELSKSEKVEWSKKLIIDCSEKYPKNKGWSWGDLRKNKSFPDDLFDEFYYLYRESCDSNIPLFRIVNNQETSLEMMMYCILQDIKDDDILNELYKRIFSHLSHEEINRILTFIKEEVEQIEKENSRYQKYNSVWTSSPRPNKIGRAHV